jgi:SAM-dependent methyltransferase
LLSSLGIEHRDDCQCLAWAERMNAWGPAGCRQQRAAISAHMRDSARGYGWGDLTKAAAKAVTTGLALRLNPLDLYGSLLDESIRRTEAAPATPKPEAAPIDILLPLGPGSRYGDLELRIALRSIEQYASGLRRVVIVGHAPAWLRETDRVRIVRRKEWKCNKAARISQKVRWAFERLDLTDTIAFWNDDYALTNPVDIRRIPTYYRGQLWRTGRDGWATLLNHTATVLRDAGRPQRHYDIHVPILFEREKFLAINDWWDRSRNDRRGYVMKSIYGNIHCHGTATTTKDCKVKVDWQKRIDRVAKRRWVISYGDAALGTGLDKWLKARYPTPTAAEQPAAKPCNHCSGKSQFCIRPGYKSRKARNDNLTTTDGAQRCVYQHALKIAAADPQVKTVLDWGCGSGAKLVEMFGRYQTLGVDVDYRLKTLQARFPDRAWGVVPVAVDADLVLCVDVIEHLDDPAELLRTIAAGRWRHLVISTPDRDRVARHKYRTRKARRRQRNGPPMNRWHAREWTADEFAAFLRHELGATAEIVILRRWNMVAHVVR